MNNSNRRNKFILVTFLLSIFVFLILGFLIFISNRGQVKIILPETEDINSAVTVYGSDFSLPLVQQLVSKESVIQLSPGKYFIVIENTNGTYARFIEVEGFMRTASVSGFTFREQIGREFVAENPKSCFSETSLGTFSYTCLGPLSSLRLHEKANRISPASTISLDTVDFNNNSTLEALYESESGIYAVAYAPGKGSLHDLYELTKEPSSLSAKLVDTISLSSGPLQQQSLAYTDKTLVLASESNVYGGDTATTLNQLVSPFDFGDNISSIGLFNNGSWATLEENLVSSNPPIINYFVSLADSNKSLEVEKPIDFTVCSDYLFILDLNNRLNIYNDNLDLDNTLDSVLDFKCVDNSPYILIENRVINITVNNSIIEGFVALDSPTLEILNLESSNSSVFARASFTNKNVLVRIDESAKKIDSLLSDLTSSQYVSSLSIGDSTVFIALELGDWIADPITGEFNYDQNTVSLAEKELSPLFNKIKESDSNIGFVVPLLE